MSIVNHAPWQFVRTLLLDKSRLCGRLACACCNLVMHASVTVACTAEGGRACLASTRVGTTTRAWTPARAGLERHLCSTGSAYARVLPEPVGASMQRSCALLIPPAAHPTPLVKKHTSKYRRVQEPDSPIQLQNNYKLTRHIHYYKNINIQ
jgi:hypothetical protein